MLGFALPQFSESADGDLARYATTAEQLGAASLWVADRLLAAVEPEVGYAGGDTIPPEFRSSLDPFTALTVAASVTTKARLGSSVLVAPWYPPAVLARQLTGIDVVSGGRLTVGLGLGWSPEEYRAAGAPFSGRGAQLDEVLDVLGAWWSANPVRHDGRRWSVPAAWVDLKPVQRPGPPVYLAAFSAAGLRRAGRRADGWMGVVEVPHLVRPDALSWQRKTVDAAAVEAGRDPSAIGSVVRINVAPEGTIDDVARVVGVLADNGFTDVFVDLLYVARSADERLDWVARLLEKT